METESKLKRPWVIGSVIVVLLLLGTTIGVKATSSTEFCLSCHEMSPHANDLKFSSHAKDKDGKPITCAQCHLPQGLGPKFFSVKIYSGVKDLLVHNFGDPENLDRPSLQVTARRFMDDANCLSCHADLYKDAKGEKNVSELGKVAHDAYLGKNGNVRNGCVNCHINLAHLPEFDKTLMVNEKFNSRIQKQEEFR